MSVTVKQELSKEINYPSIGVSVSGGTQEVDVTYTVLRISNFDGINVAAAFSAEINGEKSRFPLEFTFKYSGSGNPLDEAESALAASLK
ncbi:hypothetical protein P6O00_004724 [Klebsiella michiganensis]|uniref:hypothetical protein n=1 Tax=Klebsiella michiganensis TaxID=1134687 RepID=UPI002937EEFD|nr:hypothetical protein [Klebsiella michiganensis]ELQ7989094.1 hypothetical protein [Klebsiella michiganensis]